MPFDANELVRSIIRTLARHTATKRGCGAPLWSVVGSLTGYGSTSATRICEQFGFDPHVLVLEPEFVNTACEVVMRMCPDCAKFLYDDESCKMCEGLAEND